MSALLLAIWSRSLLTSRSSNGIFDLLYGSFEPAGLLWRAHMVLISLCAQEESVPRSIQGWAHHILFFTLSMMARRQAQVADELALSWQIGWNFTQDINAP